MEEIVDLNNIVQNAIVEKKISLYFQPIKSFNNDTSSYECLARLQNHTNISPYAFIPIIKQSGLYHEFTKRVIDLSFSIFEKNKLHFSINLDFEDIKDTRTVAYLIDNINKKNISRQLTIEILESKIENFNQVYIFVKTMKKLGVKIAIDDFGSNYCNFINIINISPNIIKIDGSIIEMLGEISTAKIIVKSITDMARNMNMKVVAEYIKNREIYQIASSQGVQYFQGFYIGKPNSNICTYKKLLV